MKQSKIAPLIFCSLAVAVNVALGGIVGMMSIPLLFLDSLGTIFVSASFGIKYGILVGVASNLLMGITNGPTAIPFALVNVAVAIVVGSLAKNGFTLKNALIAGVILSIVAPLIGTPIRLALFGGFTGSGTDIVILALQATGQSLFTSTFAGAVMGNVVDKILSCVLVCLVLNNKQVANVVSKYKLPILS